MPDAIVDLGYCAAACELEARLCPGERAELETRAAAYRGEQLRLLGLLRPPVDLESMLASVALRQSGGLCGRPSAAAGLGPKKRPIRPSLRRRKRRGARRVA